MRLKLNEPYPANWALPADQIVSPEGDAVLLRLWLRRVERISRAATRGFRRGSCFGPMQERVG